VNPTKDPFDDRANLYKQMVRVVKDKQPLAFIAENVKGLVTLHKGEIFKRVCKAFEDVGYTLSYKLVNAADYGVPQKRERVIIVGLRNDLNKVFEFPEPTHKDKWVPLSVAVPKLAIEDEKYYFSKRAVEGMKNAKPNMKRGLWQKLDEPCLTITSHLAKVSLNSRDPVLLVNPEKELYRRFTPREAARIQSFPDTFEFAGSDTNAYRQIGNAVPPVLFWNITKKLSEQLKE
jgi:DNA (cytosine-5)-methyltransferase 1